uniref:Protein lifeguard 2 n=1 Tax=Pyxicephalus adspersus TaxID=30357 RepID=A0AAV3B160_PYXAD|nr:TPA: hypothetical protein GDO54_000327 [Pyxicephalus adspersus]
MSSFYKAGNLTLAETFSVGDSLSCICSTPVPTPVVVTQGAFLLPLQVDFTSCQGVLFVLVMVLFFSGLFLVILIPFQYFLAFDTQILMGSRRFTLSPEEYIFGALNIYLDIIYIFTFFLQLFGTTRD